MKEISYEGPELKRGDPAGEQGKVRSIGSNKAPTVRTFRADVEGLIREKGTTKTEVIMAEAQRREARGERRLLHEERESHLGWIIFLLILVLAFAIGVGAYALVGARITLPFLQVATSTPEVANPTTEELGIVITDSPREQILADVSIAFGKTSLPKDSARPVTFLIKEGSGTTRPAVTAEFLSAVLPDFPKNPISESLNTDFSYEIHSGTMLSGILIVNSRFYANSFAQMLDWEPRMASELIPLMNAWYDRKYIKELAAKPFRDERMGNANIRTLFDTTGRPVLTYGFFNQKTLVIAGNKEALQATFASLAKENN